MLRLLWEVVGAHEPYRRVLEQQRPERQSGLGIGVGGVGGDRPTQRDHFGVQGEVATQGDLHDAAHPRPARDLPHAGGHVVGAVVQDVVCARLQRGLRLPLRAHGGDHLGPSPLRERDGEAPHRPRPAEDEHRLARDGPVGEDAAVGRARRDAEARSLLEAHPVGQGTACPSGTTTYSAAVPKGLPLCAPHTHTLWPTREGGTPSPMLSIVPAPPLWGITRG